MRNNMTRAQQVAEHYHITYVAQNVVKCNANGNLYSIEARTNGADVIDYLAERVIYTEGYGWETLEGATGYTGKFEESYVVCDDLDRLAEAIYAAR